MRKINNTESTLNTKKCINTKKIWEKKTQLTVDWWANRIFETIDQPKDIIVTQRSTRDSIKKLLENSTSLDEFKSKMKNWNKGVDTILDNPLEIVTHELWMKLKQILDNKWINTHSLTAKKIDMINQKDRNDLKNKINTMLSPFWLWNNASDDYYWRAINA